MVAKNVIMKHGKTMSTGKQFVGTKIGFCRDNNLNYHQFLYWFEKCNKTSAKLIPVKIDDPKQPLARLRLGNGCSLEIMSQEALTGLVRDCGI